MSEVSLRGRGHPSHRSIHVEANLLDAWLVERQAAAQQAKRSQLLLASIFMGFLILCVPAWQWALSAAQANSHLEARVATVQKELLSIEESKPTVDSKVAFHNMRSKSNAQVLSLFASTGQLLNAAPEGVAFTNFRAEILGGEMTARVRAEADSGGSAREFVSKAETVRGAHLVQILSSRLSGALSPNGVSFDFLAKVNLE
jgi:hypothetical protein